MNLETVKKKVQKYLNSDKSWPLIVDLQTKSDLNDLIEFFRIGNNKFPNLEQFCNDDGMLKIEELYDTIMDNIDNMFITELTGFLKLLGSANACNILKSIASMPISGHVVVLTYQCKDYLEFSDPRFYESGRIVIVDGEPDKVTEICFITQALADAFPASYQGIQNIGHIIDNCAYSTAFIITDIPKSFFFNSAYSITEFTSGYSLLCERDPKTKNIPENLGTSEQWNYALQKIGNNGNWQSLAVSLFGSETNLLQALSKYNQFSDNKKWIYYIALLIFGTDNSYFDIALNNAETSKELISSLFRTILKIERSNKEYSSLYRQRKDLLDILKINCFLQDLRDYCKLLAIKGEDAVYYLTDLSQLEKERIIYWLNDYGENYSIKELQIILSEIYPDLAKYLSNYRYKNDLLDDYFAEYKYQKVINKILPSFEEKVYKQGEEFGFVSALKPRTSVVDKLNFNYSKAFFVDALGVEYLGFIQEKCNEYSLSVKTTCARCTLPTLTEFNKEFVETVGSNNCQIVDIKDLDEIKHHGTDNFDYEKEKRPVYLIRELEILDELLKKIQAEIFGGRYDKAIILSDHGASRLAVIHETENKISMVTTGEHSGRCCKTNEIDAKPDYAIEENNYWVLANYDRFKGGRKANVEVHGGATLEEVAVPIIEITQKQHNVEAFIVDSSKTITLSAMEHAIISVFVSVISDDITIKLDGKFYTAVLKSECIYEVDLPDYTRKGKYVFDIFDGDNLIAVNQEFSIEKKGMSENTLFD